MSRLPAPRTGKTLVISDREIAFSFWSAKSDGRGVRALQTQVCTNDPWNIIETSINAVCPDHRRRDAHFFFDQARDYYNASMHSSILAARPLQMYYSFLNIIKVFVLIAGPYDSLDVAMHGLSEANSGRPFDQHYLEAFQSNAARVRPQINLFDELVQLMNSPRLANNAQILIKNILEQIVLGHRLWCDATNSKERFLRVAKIEYMKDGQDLWLRMYFFRDDLTRMHISHARLLDLSGLRGRFAEVDKNLVLEGRSAICIEQIVPMAYARGPSDVINDLSAGLRNDLWEVLLDVPPYRKYYVFLNHNGIRPLNQISSIYAMAYYLGSITRYRPKQFSELLEGGHGAQIREFVDGQMIQFIYQLASRMAKRDIVKPAIV